MIQKFIVTCILFLIPLISIAEEIFPSTKQFPPYPEVWGYDFSEFPAARKNAISLIGYNIPNGDYWFLVRKYFEDEGPSSGEYKNIKKNLVKFFENKNYEFNSKKRKEFFDNMPQSTHAIISSRSFFSNGDIIQRMGPDTWDKYYIKSKHCPTEQIMNSYMGITDKDGNIKARYSVILALPEPIKEEFPEDAFYNECGPLSKDRIIYKQLVLLDYQVIMLEDDTFILFGDSNLMIRFDKDFKTKFKTKVNYKTRDGRTLKTNFMVIPRDEIEKMYDEIIKKDLPRVQTIQDMVMDYMIKHQDE
jgi:hypothetical protein